ncbi:hypothetical protein C8R45DRAFT_1095324 [Mycena sanguinolenta]|nr:hypothetical protein C8R45DRAFT_1095324 [Mycena sanguinolenta]
MGELKAQGSTEYVRSGGILSAWWLKTVYGDRSLTDHTPIHTHKNLRDTPIFADDAPLAEPYIHNVNLTVPVPPIPASAFWTESLGELALRIRRSIAAYTTDLEAVRADLRCMCAEPGFNALEILYRCPPGAQRVLQTNLRSGQLADLDFSGAVASNALKTTARVVFFYPFLSTNPPAAFRGGVGVLMDDADAVWMCATRGEKNWERIGQAGKIEFTDSRVALECPRRQY